MNRRQFTFLALASTALPSLARAQSFEVTRTEAEWRAMLTDIQYEVMRQDGTERAGSSPLDKNYAAGTYYCRGCDLGVYDAATKFDSGTGWPSFYDNIAGAIVTNEDNSFFATRTETSCRRCGSHFGHIFNDGPAPTGKRHCLNGVSLVFRAA